MAKTSKVNYEIEVREKRNIYHANMLRDFIERKDVGRRDEQEIDDDTEQDEEDIEQEDSSHSRVLIRSD